LGNYFLETNLGCCESQPSKIQIDAQYEILPCNQIDDNACIILKEVGYFIINPLVYTDNYTMFFDGSKSQEGVGAGCILIDPHQHKTIISYHLEFESTNNTTKYEALVQGLKKSIDLEVKCL
jgi:hypothetical protein